MLDFRTPTLDDKELIDRYLRDCGQIDCDSSFAGTYLWRRQYDIRVAFDGDCFYKAYYRQGRPAAFAPPVTSGELRAAVDKLIDYAGEHGVGTQIGFLSSSKAELLKCIYGDRVTLREVRDCFDYIYEREHLALLSGKKYHAKRNHISRFKRDHSDYSVEELNKDNFRDAYSVAERWQADNEVTGELEVIKDAFDNFEALGMFGLVLYVEGRPVAMCVASEINDKVCDVNIEKAVEIDEAFAVINNEFAKRFDKYTLINREDDMGLEGLRKSKLSYHPDILYAKSVAVFE